jgi:toxin YoeB
MAKYKIVWSIEARLDLLDILGFYIERNKSVTYSNKLNSKINRSLKLISQNPLIGTKTDIESVRALLTGHYQFIYEIHKTLVVIVMIWDCRRDPEDKVIDIRVKLR